MYAKVPVYGIKALKASKHKAVGSEWDLVLVICQTIKECDCRLVSQNPGAATYF